MRTRLVSLIGPGSSKTDSSILALAERMGAAIIREGWGLCTGGLGGVMEAASRGAADARGAARHPPILGLLPGYEPIHGNEYLDVCLPTGLGHARNALVASAAEAIVCIGGSTGALSEVALGRKMGRPVFVFPETGGTAEVAARALRAVTPVKTVEEAVLAIREHFTPA